jgi:signal transduction histidine kinase
MPLPLLRDADRAWLATLTVLYVEDDATTRDLLGRFLRRRVARLLSAADGVEGLELFRAERPDLIITDIQMPRLDGLTMAEEIRRLDPDVPIVVTTAFEQISYLRRAIDVGVDKYVTKPVDTDKLEDAVTACVRRLRGDVLIAAEQLRTIETVRAHAREALDLLAGGLAHDFNNLLQTLLLNVALARSLAVPGSELREVIDEALCSVEQATQLGHRLHTLSGGWSAALRACSLGPTLRASLARSLTGSQTTLRLELPAGLPRVLHDASLLGRAFEQLAQNAREAMADGGVLTVVGAVRQLGDGEVPSLLAGTYVELRFGDSGPGVAPEILPKIFDPYFSTKQRGAVRGMGLGLALCLAVIRKHGGAITVDSRAGEGATFSVLLPAAVAASVETQA